MSFCYVNFKQLLQIKTDELIDICLIYPALYHVFYFNTLSDGIKNLRRNFNGFNELLRRADAANLLIDEYKEIKPGEIKQNWTSVQKGKYTAELIYIEAFLAQLEVLNKLSSFEKKELAKELLSKLEEKNKYPELYRILSHEQIGLCLVRILELEGALTNIPANISYDDLMHFYETGVLRDYKLLAAIIVMTENYIK